MWAGELTKPPVEIAGRDDHAQTVLGELIETIAGPIDNFVFDYRASFDSTLAQIVPSKRRVTVPGRS